jgi:hypothetical protein
MMDSRVLLEGAYDWPWMRPLRKPAVHPLKLAAWIVIVLFSLGFWAAAIWAAVVVFAAAT